MYATVELESGAMYRYQLAVPYAHGVGTGKPPFLSSSPVRPRVVGRTTFAQGQFRLGVVYKPVQAFHPRVFSRIKSLLRTSKQVWTLCHVRTLPPHACSQRPSNDIGASVASAPSVYDE